MFNRNQPPPPPPQGPWQQPYPQQPDPAQPQVRAWEYKVVTKLRNPEHELNELGRQGWELVAVDPDPKGTISGSASRYIMKRPAG